MASGRGPTTCDHWTWLKLPDQRLGPGSSTISSFTVTGLLKNLANLKLRKSWLTFDIIFCSKSLEVMVARRLKLSIGALDLDKVYSRRRLASHWHDWLAPLIAYDINLWSYELTQNRVWNLFKLHSVWPLVTLWGLRSILMADLHCCFWVLRTLYLVQVVHAALFFTREEFHHHHHSTSQRQCQPLNRGFLLI